MQAVLALRLYSLHLHPMHTVHNVLTLRACSLHLCFTPAV